MLYGVMLGLVMFFCLFGGVRYGFYIIFSKVFYKIVNGIIYYLLCYLFYFVFNFFSFYMGIL